MYLSPAVRSIVDKPLEGESVTLLVEVEDGHEPGIDAVAKRVEDVGGSVEDRRRFGTLVVSIAQTDVERLCGLDGLAIVETENAATIDPDGAGEDVEYDMPLRVTREKGAERSEFSEEAYNYREDRGTLEARVERFQSEFAWSEDPPSRTRHHVSNVQVTDVDGDAIHVKNNLLLYRGQGEDTSGTVLSGERQDTLRRVDGELQLARRDIRLDHTILPMKNISVFF